MSYAIGHPRSIDKRTFVRRGVSVSLSGGHFHFLLHTLAYRHRSTNGSRAGKTILTYYENSPVSLMSSEPRMTLNEKKKARGWTHPRQKGFGKGLTKGSPLSRGKGHFYPQPWDGPLSRNKRKGEGKGKIAVSRPDKQQTNAEPNRVCDLSLDNSSRVRSVAVSCGDTEPGTARMKDSQQSPQADVPTSCMTLIPCVMRRAGQSCATRASTQSSNLNLIETGAVSALPGECQFLAINRLLETFGLGAFPA